MRSKLSDICDYVKGKVDVADLNNTNYISTENMLPDKGGITRAIALPSVTQTQQYRTNDVLVSNIRPYFKKIWFATKDGGCSNDVLVFRAKDGVSPMFLYYVLSSDSFFNYSMVTSKGTKMPRGDKKIIMKYDVPDYDYAVQIKISSVLYAIDSKIAINDTINKNLVA
jgi:type I restriction enzyme S subunit